MITLDGYAASPQAVAKLKEVGTLSQRVCIRSGKYLHNLIAQDHHRIKQRIRPMLGFKRFPDGGRYHPGIELAEKINKHQFNLKALTGKETRRSGNFGGGAGRMKSAKPLARQKHAPIEICTRAPEARRERA